MHDEATEFSVCVIGDAGGAHVASRIMSMSTQGAEIHLLSIRASSLNLPSESVVETGDDIQAPPFMKWRESIKSVAGDVVNIHYANSWGAWVFALSGDQRPMVLTVMGGDVLNEEQSKHHPLAIWLTRQVMQRADLITVKSSHLENALSILGIEKDRMTRLDWGVDRSIFKPDQRVAARQKMGMLKDSFVLFSPRILNSFYRIDVIIRAFALLKAKVKDAVLVISEYEAAPGYKEHLEEIARSLGILDAIRFKDRMTPTEMATMYQASDVVVGIPPSDGFPQTVLEAMACHTPNIVAPLPTYRELLVADENVIFAEPDPDALASALFRLREDDQLRLRVIQGGTELLERFPDLDQSAANLINHLKRYRSIKTQNMLSLPKRCVGWFILLGFLLKFWIFQKCSKRREAPSTASGAH